MITEKDVWFAYQKARGKDIQYPSDKKLESIYRRLSDTNKSNIDTLVKYLNTVWQNLNLDRYMQTGGYLWKTFSYKHFLDKRLIEKYRQFDKAMKRREVTKIDIRESVKFIVYNRHFLNYYGSIRNGGMSLVINDYLQGYIDSILVVYMVEKGYLELSSIEKPYVPYIMERYEDIKRQVRGKIQLLEDLETVIDNKIGGG